MCSMPHLFVFSYGIALGNPIEILIVNMQKDVLENFSKVQYKSLSFINHSFAQEYNHYTLPFNISHLVILGVLLSNVYIL